jgi:tetratricopeptide (TPR) repeat protein
MKGNTVAHALVRAASRLLATLGILTAACAQTPPPASKPPQALTQCQQLKHYGKLAEARACFSRLSNSNDAYLRAEGLWALNDFIAANDAFRAATKAQPNNADYKVRWGRLMLDHWQPADAQGLFGEALEIQKDHPGALLGLALIAADNWEQKAAEMATAALKADPKLVEAQELLARVALEDNNPELAAKEADKAIAMSSEALDALSIRATIDWMDDKQQTPWIDKVLKINPVYGEAYSTAAHFFVINRRYDEGMQFYRKALALNPELWDAKAQLGVQLMRVGQEEEARKLLEDCYKNGFKSPETVNTLKLMDTYKRFETFRTPTTIVRLDKKEAELLKPYVESELLRAIATYDKKYKMKLNAPVQFELYPNHEDFAVRTMGMPGLGALGVTFGNVVAMDSPTARKPGTNHWASTMWHELSHVYVLTATQHRVPRWFTEGMAVHEETASSPEWGDRLAPDVIKAMADKKLLPIAELDRGFVHPSYPMQVIVSYFQAGRVCDYINEMYGYDRLLKMITAFAARKTTPEVIEQELGMKPEEFDKKFFAWLDKEHGATVKSYAEWTKRWQGLRKTADSKQYDDVIKEGKAIRDMYPDYVEGASVYELLAEAYAAKGDKTNAIAHLEDYAKHGGRYPATLKKLATLQDEAGNKQAAARALARLNYVYPTDEELHRRLGGLYLDLGNRDGAIRELQAVIAMKPLDLADANYKLAMAYKAAGKKDEARDAVLNALEAAPGYKAAQRLLLELDGKD